MDPAQVDDLERALKALANVNRIQLLIRLQRPSRLTEIELSPSRSDSWGDEARAITRQAVRRHLNDLREIGVVEAIEDEDAGVRYVVNHARLYELTERLRALATVRPVVDVQSHTLEQRAAVGATMPEGPHFVLVRGVREGQTYPLRAPAPADGWAIGRRKDAEVPLDFDPYVSSTHALVVLQEGRHFLVDIRTNRNGTLLNWQPMTRGGIAPLKTGDLVGMGMSLLLYRRD